MMLYGKTFRKIIKTICGFITPNFLKLQHETSMIIFSIESQKDMNRARLSDELAGGKILSW